MNSLDFCIKSEIDMKEEPFSSDKYICNENDLKSKEQSKSIIDDVFSSTSFGLVSVKTEDFVDDQFETSVQHPRIEHNVLQVNKNIDHVEHTQDQSADTNLDNKLFHNIQDSKFPRVVVENLNIGNKCNRFVDLQNTWVDRRQQILKISSLTSLNNNLEEDDRIEFSCSQVRSELKKNFKCVQCQYKTNRKYNFKMHLLTHSDTKLFKCSECDYECNQKVNLKRHLLTHSDMKLFKCSECDYKCNYKSDLRCHILTHSDTKLFKCSECGYKCNKKSNLRTHMLTHSNTKLLKCSECDYKCNRKHHLKVHLLTHSETKLFKCSECDYECNRKENLKRHLLTHSKML